MDRGASDLRRRRKLGYALRAAFVLVAIAALYAEAQPIPAGYLSLAAKSGVINTGRTLLHGCLLYNNGGSTAYIQFFNSVTVPSNGTAPNMAPISIAAASASAWDAGAGVTRDFSTGLSWAASTTVNTLTLIAGNDISISCQFN